MNVNGSSRGFPHRAAACIGASTWISRLRQGFPVKDEALATRPRKGVGRAVLYGPMQRRLCRLEAR